MNRFEAAVAAARTRLRPILMTSLAFILGVVPLAVAVGAGAEMRQSLGTAVFAGMLVASSIGIFMIPMLYVTFQSMRERVKARFQRQPHAADQAGGHDD